MTVSVNSKTGVKKGKCVHNKFWSPLLFSLVTYGPKLSTRIKLFKFRVCQNYGIIKDFVKRSVTG